MTIPNELERGFQDMTNKPVPLEELIAARHALVAQVVGRMPDERRRFLDSFGRGEPDWPLLGLNSIAELPAVLWRQQDLDKLSRDARGTLVNRLEQVLGAIDR